LYRHEEATQAKTHREQLQEGVVENGKDVRNPVSKQSTSKENASNRFETKHQHRHRSEAA
jgi:hypothetical protein